MGLSATRHWLLLGNPSTEERANGGPQCPKGVLHWARRAIPDVSVRADKDHPSIAYLAMVSPDARGVRRLTVRPDTNGPDLDVRVGCDLRRSVAPVEPLVPGEKE